MAILKDFKEFAVKGNVIDLAVGVIIGAAFGTIVASTVDDLFMPLINPLIPGGDWQKLVIGPGIRIGNFLAVVFKFIIVAFILFLVVKGISALKRKEETMPQPPPPPSPLTTTDKLLMEIRDSLKNIK